MRRPFLLALLLGAWLLGVSPPAEAQFSRLCKIGVVCGGGGRLLDQVPNATAAYSLRCLRAAYCATGNAVNIRRASDNTTQNIGFINNALNTALINTFCAATTCYVTEWYDQSGNGNNAAQSTQASQPQLSLSAINSLPAVVYAGSYFVNTSATPTIATSFSVSAVQKRTSTGTLDGLLATNGVGASSGISFNWTTGNLLLAAGNGTNPDAPYAYTTSAPSQATDGNPHILSATISASEQMLWIDAATPTLSTSAASLPTVTQTLYVGRDEGVNSNIDIGELIIWSPGITDAQRATVYANQKAYWGTP